VEPSTGDLRLGQRLYEINCEACHSAGGAGAALTAGFVAPALRVATPTEVAEAIRVGPGRMPVFGPKTLTDQELAAIVRYVVSYVEHPTDRGGAGLWHLGPFAEGLSAWAIGLLGLVLVIRWMGTTG
jgi:ubiquinol-cytochrome c reductase cytochrome c subunit